MPPSVQRSNAKHYKSDTVTEVKEYEGRAHLLAAQNGWEEVADYALKWALSHVKGSTPGRQIVYALHDSHVGRGDLPRSTFASATQRGKGSRKDREPSHPQTPGACIPTRSSEGIARVG
jgi:hypothetical protein